MIEEIIKKIIHILNILLHSAKLHHFFKTEVISQEKIYIIGQSNAKTSYLRNSSPQLCSTEG